MLLVLLARLVRTWKQALFIVQPNILHNHAANIWACDFLQVMDLFFRSLFVFFIIELKSRRVIHGGVTRSGSSPFEGTGIMAIPILTGLHHDYQRVA
jgi:hypothetical protein